ncbi:hypothetical protein [Calothrix sp. NIES-2098]|uniref:hypothetical protein n=1 Tax=Calothrix sp. NIES-2098 TaxID=1954171 RepID=UPI000B5FC85A|nr:hypothetical protein NIES2098_17800 [Calothrix sp. NIES-2098]
MRQLQLGNSANWEVIHNESVSAVQLPLIGGGYKIIPIPEISIAVLLDVFVLAVSVSTNVPEGREWKFAGNLRQQVSTGIVFGGSQDASFNRRYALFLDKINLLLLQPISVDYSIFIKVPDWFEDAHVIVWRYTGTDTDSIEDSVNQIKNVDLPRLEAKVDAL